MRLPGLASILVAVGSTVSLAVGGCTLLTDLEGLSGPSAEPGDAGPGADARTDGGGGGDGASPPLDAAVADGASPYVAAVLADGPVAYYPLDETTGTTARDVVAGKNGTWVGKALLGVGAVVGVGAQLDGESTRLEMPAGSFGFAGKVPYTIEVWMNPAVVGTAVRFLLDQGARNGPSGGYQIYLNNDFFLCSRAGTDGGADGYGNITPVLPGQFTHIAMTYDGTQVNLYANGSSKGPANGVLAIPSAADGRLVFGDSVGGQFFKLAALIDEIAIYDKALSEERIRAHFDAARPK
ncbi:MAG TPA: LamG domain-containing protein [Labilithrix sp.]|nr:LamG domain-containing protein [Labilithrix sp.]